MGLAAPATKTLVQSPSGTLFLQSVSRSVSQSATTTVRDRPEKQAKLPFLQRRTQSNPDLTDSRTPAMIDGVYGELCKDSPRTHWPLHQDVVIGRPRRFTRVILQFSWICYLFAIRHPVSTHVLIIVTSLIILISGRKLCTLFMTIYNNFTHTEKLFPALFDTLAECYGQ